MVDIHAQSNADFISTIPKAELHVHLRGATPISLMQQLIDASDIEKVWQGTPTEFQTAMLESRYVSAFLDKCRKGERPDVRELFEYSQFRDFLRTYFFTSLFFKDIYSFKKLVEGVHQDLVRQNVRYAEIIVSLPEYVMAGLELDDLLQVLDDSIETSGLTVRYIVDLVRNFGTEKAEALFDELVAKKPKSIIGITLGGNEKEFPPEQFVELYNKARDVDWHLTIHSGEFLGADSVDFVLEHLRPKRIGHGVRSIESPTVVEKLIETKTPLEVCISSNLFLGLYESLEKHPAHSLYKQGVRISLNSDDPTFFHTTLENEYQLALELGFSRVELVDVAKMGFETSKLSRSEKDRFLSIFTI